MHSSWDWLGSSENGNAYNGDILRNVGFIIAGVIALVFALWRALVAQSQARAAHSQTETAQQSLLNERYQRGAEMLGSPVLSVRLGGIYALQRLAEEHLEQYHIQIMRLLCAFVRNPISMEEEPISNRELRPDVQAAISAIGGRSDDAQRLEAETEFRLDLRGARLNDAIMGALIFADVDLSGAHLNRCYLREANLSGAVLLRANLSGARLSRAIISGARSGIESGRAETGEMIRPGRYAHVSQHQLDQTVADPNDSPILPAGATDPETGDPLVWHGQPFNPQS